MQSVELGRSGLRSTRLAYGCQRALGTHDPSRVSAESRAAAVRAILVAYEAGFNHFDTADIYCGGESERALGQALRDCPGMRDQVIIATKCGVRLARSPGDVKIYDLSAATIERQVEQSLTLLNIDCIDLYLLHRPDFLMNPAEVAAAFDRLHTTGKVKHFGVSNMSIPQIDALSRVCDQPIICNQIELHPLRIGPFVNGELWELLNRKIAVTAWSPLLGGVFAEGGNAARGHPERPRVEAINAALDDVARVRGVSRAVVALAWLMRHAAGVIPIIGSSSPTHIVQATGAVDFQMNHQEWYRILRASQGRELP